MLTLLTGPSCHTTRFLGPCLEPCPFRNLADEKESEIDHVHSRNRALPIRCKEMIGLVNGCSVGFSLCIKRLVRL